MNGTFRRYLPGSILVLLCRAVDSHGADLRDVYAQALESDPTYQSAEHVLEAAQQRQPEAFAALLPILSTNGALNWTHGETKYTDTPEVTRSFQGNDWVIELKQPIVRLDSYWAYDEARASVQQAVAQFTQAKQDLMLRVVRSYFDIAVAQRYVRAADAQLAAMREQVDAARHSYDAGVGSITDVDDSESRAALAEAQKAVALNEFDTARAGLESVIGSVPNDLQTLHDEAVIPRPIPEDVEAWARQAMNDNPSVKAAQAALQAGESEVKRTQAQRLPAVDLVASYGGNYSSGNITNPLNYGTNVKDRQISLQVGLPIFDGGALHAQIAEARAKRAKAESDVVGAQRQAVLDAKQAYGAVISGLTQVRALRAAVKAGESAVKGNKLGYGLGIRINSDVLNAEQQLYGTVHDLDKTQYDVLYQSLKLKAAAGQLTDGDLYALNRLLTARTFDERSQAQPQPRSVVRRAPE